MKKILLACVIVMIGNSHIANATKNNTSFISKEVFLFDTTKLVQVQALPLQNYIGKPVDSLLRVLPNQFTDRGFMPIGVGYAKGIYQSYSTNWNNNFFIEIYIDTFRFLPLPIYSPTIMWDMNLAKKETIAFIKVYKNNVTCVYGCNNPNYYYP